MCGIAINRLGVSVVGFYELTPIEFDAALQDFNKQLKDESVFKKQLGYNLVRWLAVHIWNSQGRIVKPMINDPTQLEKFEWDKEVSKEQPLDDIIKNLKAFFLPRSKRVDKPSKKRK